MALIREFVRIQKESNRVHDSVQCGWTTFESEGATILQLDTYGSQGRKIPGKMSQSLQLDATSALVLRRLIDDAFPR